MAGTVDREIEAALSAGHGVLRTADLPALRRSLQRRVATGTLLQALPGVLIAGQDATDLLVLARAVACWHPDAVLTGLLAACLTFWPEAPAREVTAVAPVRLRAAGPCRVTRGYLPPEAVCEIGGLRLTTPAFTAVDLAAADDGAAIDEALRRYACRLEDLHAALELTPGRPGNDVRRAVLRASRDRPWSQAERRLHALLRRARVTGWSTNRPVRCAGRTYLLDVAFAAERVAIEVDGYEAHTRPEQFQRDRRRWTDLQSEGWLIVHLTWEQLTTDPSWVLERLRQLRALSRSDLQWHR